MNASHNPTHDLITVTVNTKNGSKSVKTTLSFQDALQVLDGISSWNTFAADLVRNHARYGLSAVQRDWVFVIAQEHVDRQNAKKTQTTQTTATSLVNVKNLFSLFGTASLNLKYPRVRLQTTDAQTVVIKVCGHGSKQCGSLILTNGGKYGSDDNVFYGYIHQNGSHTLKNQSVIDLVTALAADAVNVVASQGLASGSCCFCSRPLSDSEAGSSEIGYGPICAEHYGLPWERNGQADVVQIGTKVERPVVKAKRIRRTKASLSA